MPSSNAVTLTFSDNGRDYSVEFADADEAKEWWGGDIVDATIATKITLEDANRMLDQDKYLD